MRLEGKVVLPTGAVSGIGHAVAELFLNEGAVVFAADIQSPKPPYSAGIQALKLDATSESDWATEIVYSCLFLASDESSYVTGTELVIDGGYLAQ